MDRAGVGQVRHAEVTTELVAAYVVRNSIPSAELPSLIHSVHEVLSGLDKAVATDVPAEPSKPAVPFKRSITDDCIIIFEHGHKSGSMKRYPASLGMTPAGHRARWGLPANHPMLAPAYAERRSELARPSGLGRKAAPEPEEYPAPQLESEAAAPAPQEGELNGAVPARIPDRSPRLTRSP